MNPLHPPPGLSVRRLGSTLRRASTGLVAASLVLPPAIARAEEPEGDAQQNMADLDTPAAEPEPAGAHVRLEVRGGRPLSLFGVESEFVGYGSGSGGSMSMYGMTFRRVCDAPCDRRVSSGTGTYFVGGGPYTASRRLQLPESGDVVVQARPGHKALYYTGWFALVFGLPMLITGATLAGLKVGSRGLQGGLIGGGAFLVAASIPLFIFGRTRAKMRR